MFLINSIEELNKRKTKNRDRVKDALDGRILYHPVLGLRNIRMTGSLLVTVNFDRSKFTAG